MMARPRDIARIVHLNGGELIGKTRLQKCVYFLERKRVGFGFDFSYHHFGPYSEDLAELADDAKILKLVELSWRESQAGSKYAVYKNKEASFEFDEADARRKEILDILACYTATELELAATADFLERNGHDDDAWTETEKRKASKFDAARVIRSKKYWKPFRSLDWRSTCSPSSNNGQKPLNL